ANPLQQTSRLGLKPEIILPSDARFPLLPAVIVDGGESISRCAELMKEHQTTAVLILDTFGKIEGIFTDRDLFLKMNRAETVNWEVPVRTVMSHPVITLTPDGIHMAPELMAKNRIRHVPIAIQAGIKHGVIGLLTMDSIFTGNVNSMKVWRDYEVHEGLSGSVGVLTDDRALCHRIEQLLEKNTSISIRAVRRGEMVTMRQVQVLGDSVPNLVIDADGIEDRKLIRTLYTLITKCKMQKIILLLTQDALPPKLFEGLKKIQDKTQLIILFKPLEPTALVAAFQSQKKTEGP
ncbi:MAG: CBS domain-containing protein, partial [Bdellovibrionota bacterium]